MNIKYIIYSDINLNFTFKNVREQVLKFWTNEITNNGYPNRWLTIIVSTKNNKS